ncbi:MAG: hypothetical protein ACRDHP_17980, partial [Ktedonobacterales bacterium]
MAERDEREVSEAVEAPLVNTMQPEAEVAPPMDGGASTPVVEAPTALPSSPPARPIRFATRARRARRWCLAFGVASIVVVLLTAVYLALPPLPAQPTRPAVVLILPRGDGVECARDAEWSPDGARLAVLGYAQGCPDGSSGAAARTGNVLVYNGLTGALMARIQPDADIASAAGTTPGSVIQYGAAVWSPAGTRLAVTFGVASSGNTVEGVYLRDVIDGAAKVLLRTGADGGATAGMWDLQAGSLIATEQLPAALGYQWTASGALAAS